MTKIIGFCCQESSLSKFSDGTGQSKHKTISFPIWYNCSTIFSCKYLYVNKKIKVPLMFINKTAVCLQVLPEIC